jgi:hypothetical protein
MIRSFHLTGVFYKQYRIVISVISNKHTKRWVHSIVIQWAINGRKKIHAIADWCQQYDSQAAAEKFAIETAKQWIDTQQ